MARSAQFTMGFRHASKRAVALLHEEAQRMNDIHARRVLDAAADMVGVILKREAERIDESSDGSGDPQ